jgi:coenzyme F420-0:L-glutamate ligase / coenzyme F420-1:gamma-L-glutamate ligase
MCLRRRGSRVRRSTWRCTCATSPLWADVTRGSADGLVTVTATALPGLPEVREGDDVAALVLRGCADVGLDLADGDVVVVSSKVVSKAAGLSVSAPLRDASVVAETVRVVASRRTPRGLAQVVESAAGPVMAAAGVDVSNTAPGTALLLPRHPDASARDLRERLRQLGSPRVAVVVSDTAGRPWRVGQTDFALGCAGLRALDDLRGTVDVTGTVLEVTERAVADEVAALADLVKGKAESLPVAVVRGLGAYVTDDDGPGARALLRASSSDWFRLGHVEAVRAALGVSPDDIEPPSVSPEPLRQKVERACAVACALGEPHRALVTCTMADDGRSVAVSGPDGFTTGVVVTRLLAALWTEDLAGSVRYDPAAQAAAVTVRDGGSG